MSLRQFCLCRLPERFEEDARVLVADPMLATGKAYSSRISVVVYGTSWDSGQC